MNAAQDVLANSVNGQSVNGQSVNVESEIEETTNENEQANEEGATHHPAGRGPGEVQKESGARGQEAEVHAEDEIEDEGTEDTFEFELVTNSTSTGRKTHQIFVETLPKALRTQALTTLTSSFGLVW